MEQFLDAGSHIVQAIFSYYKASRDNEPSRGYLGASIIGHECSRYLWYCFRHCCKSEFSGRLYRLLATGDLEEPRFTKDLIAIGCEVHDTDGNGNQFEVNALGGHFSGHMDAAILGLPGLPKIWHVGEYKTHNEKSFSKLTKEGVQSSKPQHYAQMQVYMHLTGMKFALYLAKNKNTDNLYSERVAYDKQKSEGYIDRAKRIIEDSSVPEKTFSRNDDWRCRYCDAHTICWVEDYASSDICLPVPSLSCRQCCHATPDTSDEVGGARWTCRHGQSLCKEDQDRACDKMLVLPDLIGFADAISSGGPIIATPSWIRFRNIADSKEWLHGEGGFSAKELLITPIDLLTDGMIARSKELFNAEIQGVAHDILTRYPEGDSEIVYRGPESGLRQAWIDSHGESVTLSDMAPIMTCEADEYSAQEYEGGWVVIEWKGREKAKPLTGLPEGNAFEIRRGKE